MASEDAALTRMVRSQIGRRSVDASLLDIRVSHGTIHFGGVLRTLRSNANIDLNAEMAHITTVLRQKPGVRDVIWEVTQRH